MFGIQQDEWIQGNGCGNILKQSTKGKTTPDSTPGNTSRDKRTVNEVQQLIEDRKKLILSVAKELEYTDWMFQKK